VPKVQRELILTQRFVRDVRPEHGQATTIYRDTNERSLYLYVGKRGRSFHFHGE
jgi:hypothetical protein